MQARGVLGLTCMVAACNSFDAASSPNDGGAPTVDAAPDGSTDTDGGDPRPFCARQSPAPFLCDDFEEQPFAYKWAEKAEFGGGVAENVAGTFVARGDGTVNGQTWAYLRSVLGTTTNEVVVSFAMRNPNVGVDDLELGGIQVAEGSVTYSCMLHSAPNGALSIWEVGALEAGLSDATQKTSFERNPNPLSWTRLKIHWTITPGAAWIRVYLDDDDAPVVDRPLTPTLTVGTRQVLFGATYFTKPGVRVELDDVIIDRR